MYLVVNTKKPHILYQEYGDFTSFVSNYNAFTFYYLTLVSMDTPVSNLGEAISRSFAG